MSRHALRCVCPFLVALPFRFHHGAPTHSRPRPYGIQFTARLLTLCGASVNPSRYISRPILLREYKNFILHILRYLHGEETKRNQKKQISGGGKNKGSKFAAEKGSLLARVSFRAAREISHGALAKSKREILHDVQDDRDGRPSQRPLTFNP